MTDKHIIFKCDVDCIKKNTEECFELECIYGQESILKQLTRKQQECERLKEDNATLFDKAMEARKECIDLQVQLDQLKLQLTYKEADEEEIKRIIKPYLAREDDLEVYNLDWIIKSFCKQLDQLKKRNNQLVEQNFELAQKYTKLEKETEKLKQTLQKISECEGENEKTETR